MRFDLKKLGKLAIIGLASVALVLPITSSNTASARSIHWTGTKPNSVPYKVEQHVANLVTQLDSNNYGNDTPAADRAMNYYYPKILKGYPYRDADDSSIDGIGYLDTYFNCVKYEPWELDNLGRTARVSPRWFVNHNGDEVFSSSNALSNATRRPKRYHGPNSLRHVPLKGDPFVGHHRHHIRKHHIKHLSNRALNRLAIHDYNYEDGDYCSRIYWRNKTYRKDWIREDMREQNDSYADAKQAWYNAVSNWL